MRVGTFFYKNRYISISLFLAIIVGLLFFNVPGTTNNAINTGWIENLLKYGAKEGFAQNYDTYGPYCTLLFAMFMWIPGVTPIVSLKLSILLFYIISIVLFGMLISRDEDVLLFTLTFLLCNIVDFVDILLVPFLIIAFYYLNKDKYIGFAVAFSLAALIKPQPYIVAPIFALMVVYVANKKLVIEWKMLFTILISVAVVFAFTCLFYRPYDLFMSIWHSVAGAGFLSLHALNLPYVIQTCALAHMGLSEDYVFNSYPEAAEVAVNYGGNINLLLFTNVFWLIYLSIFILVFLSKDRRMQRLLLAGTVAFGAYYAFGGGAHENHLYIGVVLAIIYASIFKTEEGKIIAILYAIMLNVNVVAYMGIDGLGVEGDFHFFGISMRVMIALCNVVISAGIIVYYIKYCVSELKNGGVDK